MNEREPFETVVRDIKAKMECIKSQSRSEVGLFLRAMEQVFTVVNRITPVVSTKPLEIFYYVPCTDDAMLDAIKDCICLTWLENNPHPRRYDAPMSGPRTCLSSDITRLPIKWGLFPNQIQRDQLQVLGINCITAYMRYRLCLDGSVIWRNGQQVQSISFPPLWHDLATMATIAERISYADILKLENPQWS